jgi:hypothetical protein
MPGYVIAALLIREITRRRITTVPRRRAGIA